MNSLVKTLLVIAGLALLQGCDASSVLERTDPSTSIPQDVAISTEDGALGIRAQMYDRFHDDDMSTEWLAGPASLSDITWARSTNVRHDELNLSDFRAGVGTFTREELFLGINDANLLINGLTEEAEIALGDRADKFRAEALFVRALLMHHGVRTFGNDPAGPESSDGLVDPDVGPRQGFDLGIIIRTQPTLGTDDAEELPRSTVFEVYDQIVDDLNRADSLFQNLPSGVRTSRPVFGNRAAVQGILARVHLYQRNYDAAESAAAEALDIGASQFGADLAQPEELGDMWDETAGLNSEAFFVISTDPVTETAGINEAISTWYATQWLAQIPTQKQIDRYPDGDPRLEEWYEPQCFDDESGSDLSNQCEDINEQGFEIQKYNEELDNFADHYVHVRAAEMKLIQAEARLNGAPGDPAEPFNDLREARDISTVSNVDIDLILEERARELFSEGHRFFDQKRLGRDISKPTGDDLASEDLTGREDLAFSNIRVLDDILPSEIENNDNLRQNPGYRQ
jgi:hypothetical protein